jgi:xanthine/uracil/vitamin C permease (AzgA family)
VTTPLTRRGALFTLHPVQGLLIGAVMVAALLSRPIEARLWRAGRISDRTAAIVLLGRFPVIVLMAGLISGASIPILLGTTAAAAIMPALFYQPLLNMLREQRRSFTR